MVWLKVFVMISLICRFYLSQTKLTKGTIENLETVDNCFVLMCCASPLITNELAKDQNSGPWDHSVNISPSESLYWHQLVQFLIQSTIWRDDNPLLMVTTFNSNTFGLH